MPTNENQKDDSAQNQDTQKKQPRADSPEKEQQGEKSDKSLSGSR